MQVPARTASATANFFTVPVRANENEQRGRLLAELASHAAPRGYRIAYDLLGDRAEAEEAVQEALASACESIGALRDPGAAHGWFLRIVTNGCLRVLRRRRLKRAIFGRLFARGPVETSVETSPVETSAGAGAAAEPAPGSDGADPADGSPDSAADSSARIAAAAASDEPDSVAELGDGMLPQPMGPSPREALVRAEELAAMMRSLDGLPAKQRAAIVLRYGHELSIAEIADLLTVEPATAKTHLVRGLVRLRELMEDHQ